MKNSKMKRIFVIVLDSAGCGEMPDAPLFGDEGSNTLKSISQSEKFSAKNLISLGLNRLDGVDYLPKPDRKAPSNSAFARLAELSKGKDTTTGHWEMGGIISRKPMPTYPNGFPKEIIDQFCKETNGLDGVLCNLPYSGTEVIKVYGEEHLRTGKLIVYTSADSVFQIAAHEDIVPIEKLYDYCRTARKILQGEHGVGRVIARPFTGEAPNFTRTTNRHDFSLIPPEKTMLNYISEAKLDVIAVGKINDIFAGSGITEFTYTHSNTEGMEKTLEIADRNFNGLCFVNLVDFDMYYGHRNDVEGYANAYAEFDNWLPNLINKLNDDDMIMITADHGCDPATPSTDHSREYVPLMMVGKKLNGANLHTIQGFSCIGATVCDLLGVEYHANGESLADKILR